MASLTLRHCSITTKRRRRRRQQSSSSMKAEEEVRINSSRVGLLLRRRRRQQESRMRRTTTTTTIPSSLSWLRLIQIAIVICCSRTGSPILNRRFFVEACDHRQPNDKDFVNDSSSSNNNNNSTTSTHNTAVNSSDDEHHVDDHSHYHSSHYTKEYVREQMALGRRLKRDHDIAPCGVPHISESMKDEMAVSHKEWKQRHDQEHRNLGQQIRSKQLKYIVPVYFHVFQNTKGQGKLLEPNIQKFMSKLDQAFAKTPFRFRHYGTNEVVNDVWYACQDEEMFKRTYRVEGNDVLNLYVCNTDQAEEGMVGYAHFPPVTRTTNQYFLDGVVIMNPSLKIYTDETVYNGLVHEVGHYLGLAHTFEGGCSAVEKRHFGPMETYYFTGDGVNDTAAHAGATYYEPGAESCWHNLKTGPLQTCSDTEYPDIDLGSDPVDNYMNYLTGQCFEKYGRFTPGQIERMVAEYETYRYTPGSNECKTQSDCTNFGGRGMPTPHLRCIYKNYHKRTMCVPCRKQFRLCQSQTDCCDGLRCDMNRRKCVPNFLTENRLDAYEQQQRSQVQLLRTIKDDDGNENNQDGDDQEAADKSSGRYDHDEWRRRARKNLRRRRLLDEKQH